MLKDKKSKIAKRFMEIKDTLDLQEVDNIYDYVRGLRVSSTDEDYDMGCGLYHISIRKINHKLFNIFIKFDGRLIDKAICNTVAETLKNFEEYFIKLLEYHKEQRVIPKEFYSSLFDDFESEQADYYLINVLGAEKDLMFMLEKDVYESTKGFINQLKNKVYNASKVNLKGLEKYINHLTGTMPYVSFEIKLSANRFSLISTMSTMTFILPKDDLTMMAKLMSDRGYLVSYTN